MNVRDACITENDRIVMFLRLLLKTLNILCLLLDSLLYVTQLILLLLQNQSRAEIKTRSKSKNIVTVATFEFLL